MVDVAPPVTATRPVPEPEVRRSPPRVLAAGAAGFLAALVVAEVIARTLVPHLPDPGWDVAPAAAHLPNLERLAGEGGVDVVFLGSSVAGAGFDASLADGYNAWLVGTPLRSLDPWESEVVGPLLDPRVVVIGVSSRDANDASALLDERHRALVSSPAMRHRLGTPTVADDLEDRIGRWSALIRHRNDLRDPSAVLDGLRDRRPIDAWGNDPVQPSGELALTATHLEQERAVLADFTVGGREMAALTAVAGRLRDEGRQVLVVDMPVVDRAYEPLHPGAGADLERYDEALDAAVTEAGVACLDARALGWDDAWFANENHLNRDGQTRLTRIVLDLIDEGLAGRAPGCR